MDRELLHKAKTLQQARVVALEGLVKSRRAVQGAGELALVKAL